MAGYDSTLSGQRVVDAVEKVENLAKVATSGSYNDLSDKPTISVAYPMESHTEATLEITPNVLHVWGEMAALTVTLGAEVEGVVNEYVFQFSSGATATTLTLPSTLTWAKDLEDVVDGVFVPAASTTYQVSIVNGLAIYTKWERNAEA